LAVPYLHLPLLQNRQAHRMRRATCAADHNGGHLRSMGRPPVERRDELPGEGGRVPACTHRRVSAKTRPSLWHTPGCGPSPWRTDRRPRRADTGRGIFGDRLEAPPAGIERPLLASHHRHGPRRASAASIVRPERLGARQRGSVGGFGFRPWPSALPRACNRPCPGPRRSCAAWSCTKPAIPTGRGARADTWPSPARRRPGSAKRRSARQPAGARNG
jgi:hypothetical protein